LRCLDSLASGAPAVEVIVVDDASADGTAGAIARRHPEVRLLANDQRAGFTGAANRGLDAATGDVLLLLNSDTEVPAASLPALEAAFADDPQLDRRRRACFPDGRAQWSAGLEPTPRWLFAQASACPPCSAGCPATGGCGRPAAAPARRSTGCRRGDGDAAGGLGRGARSTSATRLLPGPRPVPGRQRARLAVAVVPASWSSTTTARPSAPAADRPPPTTPS
jgi:hypothetical protein